VFLVLEIDTKSMTLHRWEKRTLILAAPLLTCVCFGSVIYNVAFD